MKCKMFKLISILFLSLAFIFFGAFCCCVENVFANIVKEKEQHCCAQTEKQEIPRNVQDRECCNSVNVLSSEMFKFLDSSHKVMMEASEKLSSFLLLSKEIVNVDIYPVFFNSGPPIYILNSVYRL